MKILSMIGKPLLPTSIILGLTTVGNSLDAMITGMNVNYLIYIFCLVSLLNPGLFIVASKWRIVEYYEIYRKPWLPKKCEFCLFFWLTLFETLVYFICFNGFGFYLVFLIPFSICSAVLSRKFV